MVTLLNYQYQIFPFKYVCWQLNESFSRVRAREWIDYDEDAKKFLCLNRWPKQHRFYFMSQMNKHNLLDQFNWSFLKRIESYEDFEYDVAFPFNWTDDHEEFGKLTPQLYDGGSIKLSGLYWDFPNHKKESLMYIVTESEFTHTPIKDVSEKTWRPIAMQMPFIMIGQTYSLRRLRDIGYRTFHSIWDESYDEIRNSDERMSTIVDLVVELNSREDFRDMIDSCREIVKHNYKLLKLRRSEDNMISALL